MAESELLIQIGKRLKEQRIKMHLTQEMAAELLDISTTFYGEIERGKKRVSLVVILRIYYRMHLDINYLLTGESMEEIDDSIYQDM